VYRELDGEGDQEDAGNVKERGRRPLILLLAAGGLLLTALALLFATAPSPTVLSIQVVNAETGVPMPGAAVRLRASSGSPLPTATTDEAGITRFEDLPSDSAYLIRVQKVDFDVIFEPSVAVPEGRETEVTVALPPNAGGRLFVGLDGARVAEIDTASFLVVRTFRLPDWKQGATRHIRVHPSEDLLYTVAGGSGWILDGQSGTSLERFEVEGTVEALSTDGSLLYVVTGQYDGPGQLLTLDAHTGALLATAETDNPQVSPQLFWKPDGDAVYAVEPSNGSLWVLGTSPSQVLAHTPTGAYPKEGLLSVDGHYVYTWPTMSFDELRATFQFYMTPVPASPSLPVNTSGLSLSPTEAELYALDAQLGTLYILDPSGEEPPILVAVGKRPVALVVSPDGMWAYVANRESHTISVVHLPSASVVQSIPVDGEPLAIAVR
jgi:YVTN family beta-propeller protein